jgi:hypothetical protein
MHTKTIGGTNKSMDKQKLPLCIGQVFVPDPVMDADRIDGCVPAVGTGTRVISPINSDFGKQEKYEQKRDQDAHE